MSETARVSASCNNQTMLDQLVARVAMSLLLWANRRNESVVAPVAKRAVRHVRRGYYSASSVVTSREPRGHYFT
jgi:hypothetical protein